jgi:hypothetical protein
MPSYAANEGETADPSASLGMTKERLVDDLQGELDLTGSAGGAADFSEA